MMIGSSPITDIVAPSRKILILTPANPRISFAERTTTV